MNIVTASPFQSVAELLHALGDVPSSRVRMKPAPGMATEKDLIESTERKQGLCELVEETLVEKPMGHFESRVAAALIGLMDTFAIEHDLGLTYAPDCDVRLLPGTVRKPDVSFVSWDRLPDRLLPPEAITPVIPDLAVEVLSPSNTRREMARKRGEYFAAGVRLVWEIDPTTQTAQVFTDAANPVDVPQDGNLHGADVVPGFVVSLKNLFERAGRQGRRRST